MEAIYLINDFETYKPTNTKKNKEKRQNNMNYELFCAPPEFMDNLIIIFFTIYRIFIGEE